MTLRRAAFLTARAALRAFDRGPDSAVLILGHMRSGSTLLMHLLMTSREIIGCGERNARYGSPLDLDRLAIEARLSQRAPFRRVRYAADQINHNDLLADPGLLRHDRVRSVFLIRYPRSTIDSILRLRQGHDRPWSARDAVDYYVHRLDAIARYAAGSRLGQSALALTYDEFVHDTAAAFRRLESFLGLRAPLSEHYDPRPFTGRRGDRSDRIRSGRIVRDRSGAGTIAIPTSEIERAERSYRRCARALDIGDERI